MVSEAVLMVGEKGWRRLPPGAGRAVRAQAADGDLETVGFETFWHGDGRFGVMAEALDVVGPGAFVAIEVVVGLHVGTEPGGGPVLVHLPDEAATDQRVQAVVDRGD